MANFDRSGMTQAGINLMGKAVGGATIQFTRLVLGDGTMTGEILDLQGVVSPKQNVDVTRIERNDNQCTVGGELLTSSVKQGFFWRECGLYAMDPDVGEILYNYAYSTKPDYIAASDSGMMEEILVSMIATVGSNTNVDVTIDSSMLFTTKKEFIQTKQKIDGICISVHEFGAIGDGFNDDTISIQNAIDSIQETGGIVMLEPKTYNLTDTIYIREGVSLEGVTCVHQNGNTKVAKLNKLHNGIGIKLVSMGANLRNINLSSTSKSPGIGIHIANGRVSVEDVSISNLGGDAIRVGKITADDSGANCFILRNIFITYCSGDGIVIKDDTNAEYPDCNAGGVYNVDIRRCQNGIVLGNSIDDNFYNVSVQMCHGIGIWLKDKARGHKFFGQYTEANDGGEIILEPTTDQNIIIGTRTNQYIDQIQDNANRNLILSCENQKFKSMIFNKLASREMYFDAKGISGIWACKMNSITRDLEFDLVNTNATACINFKQSVKFPDMKIGDTDQRIRGAIGGSGTFQFKATLGPSEYTSASNSSNSVASTNHVLSVDVKDLDPRIMCRAVCDSDGTITVYLYNCSTETINVGTKICRYIGLYIS